MLENIAASCCLFILWLFVVIQIETHAHSLHKGLFNINVLHGTGFYIPIQFLVLDQFFDGL